MYTYEYVDKSEWRPVRDELLEMIHQLQDEVREHFTFQFRFVGSSKRNMITRRKNSNTGFDFDVNLEVNVTDDAYTPGQIRLILRQGLDRINRAGNFSSFGYRYAEDSTRVLTTKVVDRENSRILHSCDFCIVRKGPGGRTQYIRNNKLWGSYTWEYLSEDFKQLPEKINWIKRHGLWQEVRELYLHKKNTNWDPSKHSRSIFAETVHEVWQNH